MAQHILKYLGIIVFTSTTWLTLLLSHNQQALHQLHDQDIPHIHHVVKMHIKHKRRKPRG